jgi:hypothetical protein
MTYLTDNLNRLEQDLTATPMRIAAHKDMPAAIFCYPPAEEFQLRRQLRLLSIKLEQKQKHIRFISLARIVWETVEKFEGEDYLYKTESARDLRAAQAHINHLLTRENFRPAGRAVKEALEGLDPDRDIAFLVRAGGFAPYIYRCSVLLDELQNEGGNMVPTILFYPGSRRAGSDLKFYDLPVTGTAGAYNYRVKIYGVES